MLHRVMFLGILIDVSFFLPSELTRFNCMTKTMDKLVKVDFLLTVMSFSTQIWVSLNCFKRYDKFLLDLVTQVSGMSIDRQGDIKCLVSTKCNEIE